MIEALDQIRPTAVPAVLFLVWFPVFMLLPARHARAFFIVASLVMLLLVGGPLLAGGLLLAVLVGYALVEGVTRLATGRRAGFIAAVVLLHMCYWACFHLPLPAAFQPPHLRISDGPGIFIFFSGIGLTFLRLLSYLVDRVRRDTPRLPLGGYLACMLFFPQFRHGPIERAPILVPKLREARRRWTPRDLGLGLARIGVGIGGLAAVAVVAIPIARTLPEEFRAAPFALLSHPERLTLPQLLLLIHLPALVLYIFESSFASIQLGVSRVFGVQGSENFRFPFLAPNPRELWRRWNTTLSHWLRDYAYIPIGGNTRRKYLNVFLVFVYCGLLHGFQMRCLMWGLWTGSTMACYLWVRDAAGQKLKHLAILKRHPVLRVLTAVLGRLATLHWFCIGVTIILDPHHCGFRVLRRYVCVIASCLSW